MENFTNHTQQDDLGPSDNNFWVLPVAVLPIVTVLGNVLVIISVWREKTLQNSTNWLIVSLAFADLLVGLIVMPWGIYASVSPIWRISFLMCDIYISMDVICSTASILNLVAISIDRYEAVTNAVKYSQNQSVKNKKRLCVYLTAVWGVATIVGLPILLGLNNLDNRESEPACTFNNPDFIIFSSLTSFYVPCVIILVLYHKILKVLAERSKQKSTSDKDKKSIVLPKQVTPTVSKLALNRAPPEAKNETHVISVTGTKSQPKVVINQPEEISSESSSSSASLPDPILRIVRRLSGIDPPDQMSGQRKASKSVDLLTAWWSTSATNGKKNIQQESQSCNVVSSSDNPRPNRMSSSTTETCLSKVQLQLNVDRGRFLENCDSINKKKQKMQDQPDASGTTPDLKRQNSSIANNIPTELNIQTNHKSDSSPSEHIELFNITEDESQESLPLTGQEPKIVIEKDSSSIPPPSPILLKPSLSKGSLKRSESKKKKSVVNFSNDVSDPLSSDIPVTQSPNMTPATPSPCATPLHSPGRSGMGPRKLGIAASARLLRRAASWKSKSVEKIMARQERRENRATKTLAIVLGCFLCCWIPFFTCNILSGISKKFDLPFLEPPLSAFLFTTWLGYINSALNPFIYTIFNREFRKAFEKIFKDFSKFCQKLKCVD